MGNKTQSLVSVVVVTFIVLFFGPAMSNAQAGHAGPRVSFQGHFPLPHGSIHVYANNGPSYHQPYYRHHRPSFRHSRPHYGRSYYRHHRPYRTVRVLVYDPYPRWVYRRVYYSPRGGGAYRRPY